MRQSAWAGSGIGPDHEPEWSGAFVARSVTLMALMPRSVVVMEGGKVVEDGGPKEIFCRVDAMRKRGLDVPLAAEIAWRLRKQGIRLPEDIVTDEELAVALCR